MTAANTVVLAQRNRIIRRFKAIGATAPQRAIDPITHHIRQSLVFDQLVKVESHHFYLDEARATTNGSQRTQTLATILIVIAIATVLYFFVQWLM